MSSPFHKTSLRKPDGRALHLYGRGPVDQVAPATNPRHDPIESTPHLRWHPWREEWVAYASHRQNRTFLPPKEYNPLAPARDPEFPTELPQGRYDMAVFENLFASLSPQAETAPDLYLPTRPARGVCEVVVFTQDPDTSLGLLPIEQIRLLLDVWIDRTRELGARGDVQYVLPFENRGVEVGVTLHHPHGQIYSYPVVPPVAKRMHEAEKRAYAESGRPLFEKILADEKADGRRIVFENFQSLAFIPACARYPYETWVCPKRSVAYLSELNDEELWGLARALKTVLLKYDGLWNRRFPYLMVLYQAPTDGRAHPEAHAHFEFYPPYRTADRLKFLAGTELGAGLYVNDSLPEEKALELRRVEVSWNESEARSEAGQGGKRDGNAKETQASP